MQSKQIDKIGKVVVGTLMLILLWILLVLPASTFSLLSFEKKNTNVLSDTHTRKPADTDYYNVKIYNASTLKETSESSDEIKNNNDGRTIEIIPK